MASGSGTHYTPKIKAALETMKDKLVGRLEVRLILISSN